MAKRTQIKIEKDYKRIRDAAQNATSISDIAKTTNLSRTEILVSLKKHPIIYKNIKEQLIKNAEQKKLEMQERKALENVEVLEVSTKVKNRYVLDISLTGYSFFKDMVDKILENNSKIILTSVVIKELERQQRKNEPSNISNVRYILAKAAELKENFETILINETFETPDDCIIDYCVKNKDNAILCTSDKTMSLKARMYGVEVEYYKVGNQGYNIVKPKINNLIGARRFGDKLVVYQECRKDFSILVYSNGIEQLDGLITRHFFLNKTAIYYHS